MLVWQCSQCETENETAEGDKIVCKNCASVQRTLHIPRRKPRPEKMCVGYTFILDSFHYEVKKSLKNNRFVVKCTGEIVDKE